jgi:4'-phosphopantetheinyl transferase
VKLNWSLASDQVDLSVGDVHVWAVALQIDPARQQALERQLRADERQRAGRFMCDEPRQSFIASRAALRSILGRYLGTLPTEVPIVCDGYGKPGLAGRAAESGLRFNLAHSGQLALVAVAFGCDVGVDVEALRPIEHWRGIAARYFHPDEAAAIAAAAPSNRNAAFLRCWTRKEAILKAVGVGLAQSLQSFAVPVADRVDGQIDVNTPSNLPSAGSKFWLQSLSPLPDYVAAVATRYGRRDIVEFVYR